MNKSDFFYDLPAELIAQHPCEKRDNSSLMHLNRKTGEIEHLKFYDLPSLLNEGDTVILNDTKVLPARLTAQKSPRGRLWNSCCSSSSRTEHGYVLRARGKKAKKGDRFSFGEGKMSCEVVDVKDDGNRVVKFEYDGNFYEILDEIGSMPLPPYITEKLKDNSRYQTIYAKHLGSAAAPTAGLHFTDEVFATLGEKGINIGYVTLHVGLGTFRPVKEEKIEDHLMHTERYYVPKSTAELINATKKAGKRVICIGTTSCRTLEAAAKDDGTMEECSGKTDIFIYPGYKFKCMDGLVTNFHLPESTLIMLVSAFAGYEHTMNALQNRRREKNIAFSASATPMVIL